MLLDCAECIVVQFLILHLYRVSVFSLIPLLRVDSVSVNKSHLAQCTRSIMPSFDTDSCIIPPSHDFRFLILHNAQQMSIAHTYGQVVFVPLFLFQYQFGFNYSSFLVC